MYSPSRMSATLPKPDRSIVLVGLMGAGKSTVGKRLAKRLGLPFVDTDEEIERAADHSVSEIFARFGEASFRDGERRVIARLIEGPPKVIATGGGAFANEATRTLAKERAVTVWIDADIDVLVDRVARRGNRPLLVGKDPRAVLAELAAKRRPYYAEAQIHVKSAPQPHESTVNAIIRAIGAQGET